MKVYVYALRGQPATLQYYTESLGQPVYHWIADAARLTMGTGVPHEWKDQGAIFGPEGELRWWKEGTEYSALLLADKPLEGLDPLPGNWTAKEEVFFLQDLGERRLKPTFAGYPHGAEQGRLRAKVYFRNTLATFVSPRQLERQGGPDAKG